MNEALSHRLKQSSFASPAQEALLALLLAAGHLNEKLEAVCEQHGITRAQYNVLRILRGAHPNGHPRCEIACRMLDRAPDITRLVDRLQVRGLVKRSRSDRDQRQAVTYITAKGLKLLEAMQTPMDDLLARCFGKLTQQDSEELTRLCALIFGCGEDHTKAGGNESGTSSKCS
jgi:DNA-binding MarR family transcriptional regulator